MSTTTIYQVTGILSTIEGNVNPKGLRFDIREFIVLEESEDGYFTNGSGIVKKSEIGELYLIQSTEEFSFIRYDVNIINKEEIDLYKNKIKQKFNSVFENTIKNIEYYKGLL